jgi:hypothetical protein
MWESVMWREQPVILHQQPPSAGHFPRVYVRCNHSLRRTAHEKPGRLPPTPLVRRASSFSAVGRLRSPPPARSFSGAAGTCESPDREGAVAASAVVTVGSGLGFYLMASVVADAGDTAGG